MIKSEVLSEVQKDLHTKSLMKNHTNGRIVLVTEDHGGNFFEGVTLVFEKTPSQIGAIETKFLRQDYRPFYGTISITSEP